METLSQELLALVLGHLPFYDRLVASLVCKKWYDASMHPEAWRYDMQAHGMRRDARSCWHGHEQREARHRIYGRMDEYHDDFENVELEDRSAPLHMTDMVQWVSKRCTHTKSARVVASSYRESSEAACVLSALHHFGARLETLHVEYGASPVPCIGVAPFASTLRDFRLTFSGRLDILAHHFGPDMLQEHVGTTLRSLCNLEHLEIDVHEGILRMPVLATLLSLKSLVVDARHTTLQLVGVVTSARIGIESITIRNARVVDPPSASLSSVKTLRFESCVVPRVLVRGALFLDAHSARRMGPIPPGFSSLECSTFFMCE
jgi:hypothetical protein